MKRITLALFLPILLWSCQKENIVNDKEEEDDVPEQEVVLQSDELLCVAPGGIESKTAFEMDGDMAKVLWVSGDEIKVFSEGVSEGSVYATSDDKVSSAVFSLKDGETATDASKARYAYYPAALVEDALSDGKAVYDLSGFRSQVYCSSLQECAEAAGSIASSLPFYAKSEAGSGTFSFSNLFGAVRVFFNDYQGHGIRIAKVRLTADRYLTGSMTVGTDGTVTLSGNSDEERTITIDCGQEGLMARNESKSAGLSNGGTPFYFFLPVGDYASLSFEFTDTEGRVYRKTTESATVVTVSGGSIKTFPVLNLTLYYGEENCVVVAPSSTAQIDVTPKYTFDERLRRSSEDSEVEYVDGKSAPVLTAAAEWQLLNNESEANNDKAFSENVIESVLLEGNTLSVTSKYNRGNALVTLKDEDGIVWSWHIWVTSDIADENYVVSGEQFSMMDRNLGASRKLGHSSNAGTARKNAYCTYGMLYQWGRKDPLPIYGVYGDNSSAGTGCREGAYVLFGCDAEAAEDYTVVHCLRNPLKKVMSSKMLDDGDENYTVLSKTAKNGILWGASESIAAGSSTTAKSDDFVKTVYDPCPEGYMVPQGWHFSGLAVQASDRNWWATKVFYDGKTSSDAVLQECAFYPLGGCVGGKVVAESGVTKTTTGGTYSRYWTANPYGETGWAAACMENKYSSSTMTINHTYAAQAGAYSVRCLKIAQ